MVQKVRVGPVWNDLLWLISYYGHMVHCKVKMKEYDAQSSWTEAYCPIFSFPDRVIWNGRSIATAEGYYLFQVQLHWTNDIHKYICMLIRLNNPTTKYSPYGRFQGKDCRTSCIPGEARSRSWGHRRAACPADLWPDRPAYCGEPKNITNANKRSKRPTHVNNAVGVTDVQN